MNLEREPYATGALQSRDVMTAESVREACQRERHLQLDVRCSLVSVFPL